MSFSVSAQTLIGEESFAAICFGTTIRTNVFMDIHVIVKYCLLISPEMTPNPRTLVSLFVQILYVI